MKRLLVAVALPILLGCHSGFSVDASSSPRYPNELLGYELHDGARWATLRPLHSRMADVRETLGPPDETHDVANPSKPYPGDANAISPVWWYHDGDWNVLIYFASYCFVDIGHTDASDRDLLCSIDLIPRTRVPFDFKYIPPIFDSMPVDAVCARWIEYRDTYGLRYEVFTSRTAYGDEQPGDLNRIGYGPSDAEISEFRMRHPSTRSN